MSRPHPRPPLPVPVPGMVEVAPNRYVQMDLSFELPETVFCDLVEAGDGKYKLVPRTWERLERVTGELCRQLGLGTRTDTLRRLIRASFVDGGRPSPDLYTVNLASYFAHLKRCAEDPGFWENPKVLAEYRESL
jgi:hypothetical protein